MKIVLGELQQTLSALQGVLTQRLPVKAAYWFGKFLKKAQEEFADFEENRTRLCRQYCVKDEKGEPVRMIDDGDGRRKEAPKDHRGSWYYDFSPESRAAFDKELKVLQETELVFDRKPLRLEDLGEDLKVTPQEMVALLPFIEDDEEGGKSGPAEKAGEPQ